MAVAMAMPARGAFAVPRAARFAVAAAVLGLGACTNLASNLAGRPGPEAGLLRGKAPARSSGVTHVGRLTDGIASVPWDPPITQLSSVLSSPDAFVVFDLGRATDVGCAVILADGDDRYTLALSADGQAFTPLWTAEPDGDRGQQPRVARDLRGNGRWLRLTAAGGDGVYAVTELAVAETCPPRWPPVLAFQNGTPLERAIMIKGWAFAALAIAFILAYSKRAPDWLKLGGAIPAGVAIALAVDIADLWPLPGATLATVLVVLFLVAGAAAGRRLWQRKHRRG
jgi:hypothetical protein